MPINWKAPRTCFLRIRFWLVSLYKWFLWCFIYIFYRKRALGPKRAKYDVKRQKHAYNRSNFDLGQRRNIKRGQKCGGRQAPLRCRDRRLNSRVCCRVALWCFGIFRRDFYVERHGATSTFLYFKVILSSFERESNLGSFSFTKVEELLFREIFRAKM